VTFLAVLTFAGCGTSGIGTSDPVASAGPSQGSVVVLDVFSGRPNPTWVLDPAVQLQLAASLADLPITESAPSPLSTLGFRSATVTNVSTAHGHAALVEVRVGSAVLTLADGQTIALYDAQSQALRVLLQDAAGHVDRAMLDEIREQIK